MNFLRYFFQCATYFCNYDTSDITDILQVVCHTEEFFFSLRKVVDRAMGMGKGFFYSEELRSKGEGNA
jgi:hypothetical protein